MRPMDDEVKVVAQAITDAHARTPGGDCEGRLDDARTIIAAVDALTRHRKLADVAASLGDASSVKADASPSFNDASQPVHDASTTSHDASDDASSTSTVVPIKGKKPRKSAGDAS